MPDPQPSPRLRAARAAAGWSQSAAAARLAELAGARGAAVAGAASLKTQLSRWENGHALPEPLYRDLLSELYERTPAELGIAPVADPASPAGSGPARFRAALATAGAAGRAGAALWWDQLAAIRRLDDELGAAGAGGAVDAQIERLTGIVRHALDPAARTELAAVLAAVSSLGGAQSLDRGRHDQAWLRYAGALAAARAAGLPVAAARAIAGQAEVLVDVGEAPAAVELLRHAEPVEDAVAAIRLASARALATAAAGDQDAAHAAITEARHRWRAGPVDVVHPLDGPPVLLADLDRWHGHALVDLGESAAVEPLDRALTADRPAARERAQIHADLAVALRAERPGAAAEHAATARALAAGIGSERVVARLASGSRGPRGAVSP
jgi:transcriptional regulator with XRE-family HTH domain